MLTQLIVFPILLNLHIIILEIKTDCDYDVWLGLEKPKLAAIAWMDQKDQKVMLVCIMFGEP